MAYLPHGILKVLVWGLHPNRRIKFSINVYFHYLQIIDNFYFIIPLSPFSQRFSSIGAKLLAHENILFHLCHL